MWEYKGGFIASSKKDHSILAFAIILTNAGKLATGKSAAIRACTLKRAFGISTALLTDISLTLINVCQ